MNNFKRLVTESKHKGYIITFPGLFSEEIEAVKNKLEYDLNQPKEIALMHFGSDTEGGIYTIFHSDMGIPAFKKFFKKWNLPAKFKEADLDFMLEEGKDDKTHHAPLSDEEIEKFKNKFKPKAKGKGK